MFLECLKCFVLFLNKNIYIETIPLTCLYLCFKSKLVSNGSNKIRERKGIKDVKRNKPIFFFFEGTPMAYQIFIEEKQVISTRRRTSFANKQAGHPTHTPAALKPTLAASDHSLSL
jgi:hypothetical protein